MDVGEYLDQWIARQRLRLQPRTWDAYRQTIDAYLAPALADVALADLKPTRLDELYGELIDHGGRRGRPLSLATIRYIHGVLHKALADAVRLDLLPANAADRVALPRHDLRDDAPATVQAWNDEEARRFLQGTRDDVHASLWAVALGTGMRRGELLGLRWRDVSLDDRLVTVTGALTEHRGRPRRKTTKTNRIRRLFIDGHTAAALEPERQARRPPTTIKPLDLADLVFTEGGAPLSPQRTTHRFRRLVRRLDDVPTIRLHDVRHTHATLLLQAGVPIKVDARQRRESSLCS
ncbi:MAG TPA: tyrosine-type recombinase/integrase [Euzebyales bacterium]|nr:tyrosine-type recombinase/integrase [Euzebyales bacterium]